MATAPDPFHEDRLENEGLGDLEIRHAARLAQACGLCFVLVFGRARRAALSEVERVEPREFGYPPSIGQQRFGSTESRLPS